MNIDEKIKELEEKLEEIKKENEKQKGSSQDKYERWRAKFAGKYYFINTCGEIEISLENITAVDNYRHAIGNYSQTEKQAGIIQQNRLTYQQLKDIALRLNEGQEIDWEDVDQQKYYIIYGNDTNQYLLFKTITIQYIGQVYSLDKNFLDIALSEIGKEKLKQLLEWGI